jgi:hypothetical protein
MQKFTNDFLKLKNKQFALYGAGSGSSSVFDYLNELDFDTEQIICFIDRDISKQGKILRNRKILAPVHLLEHPELVVVIGSMYYKSIVNNLRMIGASNQIYGYMHFIPPYKNIKKDFLSYKQYDIQSMYDDQTPLTNDIIEICMYFRQSDICRIQPIEQVINYSGSENYWVDSDMPNLDYAELTILDGGAYTGDTFKMLYEKYGQKIKRYYAFEPDPQNNKKLEKTLLSAKGNVDARILKYGLSDMQENCLFESDNLFPAASHILNNGGGGG